LENYQKAGEYLGLDLVNNPNQVDTDEVGMQVSGWFWHEGAPAYGDLNYYADQGDFDTTCLAINGG
jgi:predicted chitinase